MRSRRTPFETSISSFRGVNTSPSSFPVLNITSRRFFFGLFKKKPVQDAPTGEQSSSSEHPRSVPRNPFASIPGMPQLPNQPSPLGVAKDIWNVTKAAKQMSKEAHPEGGLKALTESQMAQMRAVLELQKKVASQVSGGGGKMDSNAMSKLMAQSSDMFEKMLDPMEKALKDRNKGGSADADSPSPKEIAENALKGMTHLPPSRGQAHQQEVATAAATATATATGGGVRTNSANNSTSAKSSTPSSPSPSPPSPPPLGGSTLSPEIEALFAELREMRGKKNYYRDKFQQTEKELTTAKTSLKQSQQHEGDLRKRLSQAEHTVTLLQSESLELRDKKNELTGQLKKASAELTKTRPTTSTLVESQKQLELDLASTKKQNVDLQKDVARLERKISRLRKHASPINDLSELLTELSRVGSDVEIPLANVGALSSSSSANLLVQDADEDNGSSSTSTRVEFRNAVADDAFNAVRDKYEQLAALRFEEEDSRKCDVAQAIADVALELIRARIPHALLDCVISVSSDDKIAENVKTLVQERNEKVARSKSGSSSPSVWEVKVTQNPGLASSTITVTESGDAETPSTGLGPFGYFATYFATATNSNTNNNNNNNSVVIHPFLSTPLVNNTKRAKILTDKARSSKPGGQASNVGETKITHRLLIDGNLVASATSQDSRSAMHNIDTAMERLMTEKLPVANQKLKHLPQLRAVDGSSNSNSNSNVSGASSAVAQSIAPSLKSSFESIEQQYGALVAGSVKFALSAVKAPASSGGSSNNSNESD